MRILVVEDERSLREGLEDLLRSQGYEVDGVGDGRIAVEWGRSREYDLVLLDLMLPGLTGLEVCRQIRQSRPDLPILMVTARGAETDKVAGFAAGADDYVTKPFGVRELLARVDAVTRRLQSLPTEPDVCEIDGCRLDLGRHVAFREGREIPLTPREVGVLRWLRRHRARAVSRAELLERVWCARPDIKTRTVDMTIVKLRQKIERNAADPRIVVTVTGAGYAWGEDEETP